MSNQERISAKVIELRKLTGFGVMGGISVSDRKKRVKRCVRSLKILVDVEGKKIRDMVDDLCLAIDETQYEGTSRTQRMNWIRSCVIELVKYCGYKMNGNFEKVSKGSQRSTGVDERSGRESLRCRNLGAGGNWW